MTVEVIIAGSAMVMAGVAVCGVLVTWRRNSNEQTARDERLALNQDTILERLDDPKHGLTAINDKVNDMVNHCGRVSTGLEARLTAAERDVKELKQR